MTTVRYSTTDSRPFPDQPTAQQPVTAYPFTVRARLEGWPVEVQITARPAELGRYLARLAELGYEPDLPASPPQAPAKTPRPRATRYDTQGTPICPIHGTAMLEGQRGGYYCGHKAAPGEPAGPKGYCNAIAE